MIAGSTAGAGRRYKRAWRFSLRTLIAAMTLLSVGCWWLCLPSIRAVNYVRAINSRNTDAANRFFADNGDKFPGNLTQHQTFEAKALAHPLRWRDVWSGERSIEVGVRYGDGTDIYTGIVFVRATRHSLELPQGLPRPIWRDRANR